MTSRGARFGAAAAIVWLALVASPRADAQTVGRVAVLPITDGTGALTTDDVAQLTSSLRGRVPSAVAAETDTESLRYVADGVARTTVTGTVGSRSVDIELVIYASGEVRRGQASESEATEPDDGTGVRLRAAVSLAFRRATSGLSIVVNDAPPSAPPPYVQPVPVPPPYQPPYQPPYVEPPVIEPPPPSIDNVHVLQFGVRALANRFAGLFQLGVLQSDAERFFGGFQLAGWEAGAGDFYGLFQLGLKQSVAERDFVGLGQFGVVMSSAGKMRGLAQVALFENTVTDSFIGGIQVSPMRNQAAHFVGLAQVGVLNRAEAFQGLVQLGVHNRAGPEDAYGDDSHDESQRFRRFVGVGQVGLFNQATRDYYGLVQLGVANTTHRADFIGGAQLGVFSSTFRGNFYGLLQLGAAAHVGKDFAGLVQVGAASLTRGSFSGIAQLGAFSYVGYDLIQEVFGSGDDDESHGEQSFRGVLQAGAVSITDRDFQGLVQFGGLGVGVGRDFSGLAQIGGLATYVENDFHGVLQLAGFNYTDNDFYGALQVGVASYVDDSFSGLSQIGALNLNGGEHTGAQLGVVNGVRQRLHGLQAGALSYAEHAEGVQLGGGNLAVDMKGVQLGVVNYAGGDMTGVQIGLVNRAGHLRGIQLGLINIAKEGGFLPVFPVVNAGF